MIWTTTFLFFLVSLSIIWVGFNVYARTLKVVGAVDNKFVKHTASILIYAIFSALLISPILFGLSYFSEWNIAFRENTMYMVFFLLCYILSVLPGALYFKKTHLESLRQLGYFKNK
ncbi:hypothetical protein [Vibrio mytili]|uniref:Uncharacterized protein n=1 Tax=Vibrio mytili TaxID=50718 RepID=A0A0C3DJF0_9VIBR|nr:hypothetical protein [Vibrio mytili]KIN11554.1 hypothetical protein SU60_07065 [Vibrio mytili]